MTQANQTNQDIIRLLAEGKTAKEVAAELDIKTKTVRNRLRKMRKDYHCITITQLVVTVLSLNIDGLRGNA